MNKSDKKLNLQAPVSEKIRDVLEYLKEQNAVDAEDIYLENSFTDAMIVASSTSRRHAQGLADGVARLCAKKGYEFFGMEGYENAQWILADCNDLVIHIFQKDIRDLYKLEELWARSAHSMKGGLE